MVAYSFKEQFAEPILAETKGGTIRKDRKRHARPGEELQLYTAMRTKQCRLIARKTCLDTASVELDFSAHMVILRPPSFREPLTRCVLAFNRVRQLDIFARFDGFGDWGMMRDFWRAEHDTKKFAGQHIRWLALPPALFA